MNLIRVVFLLLVAMGLVFAFLRFTRTHCPSIFTLSTS